MGFTPAVAIPDAICQLTPANFYKSKEDRYIENDWQDAYQIHYEGQHLYIKFVIRSATDTLVITSFHEFKI